MITYFKGDILKDPHPYILQGVNCQGKMASGIAKQIRAKWPIVYERYMDKIALRDPEDLLGYVFPVVINEQTTVVNCFTQLYYGYDGKRYVSYDAIDDCCRIISKSAISSYIAMPKIGAGLGGGEWSIIESIINHNLKDIDVRVYEL